VGEPAPRLILASASPRRLELLRLAGLEPVVQPADIDETPLHGEDPVPHVLRLARDKACAVTADDAVVLGADTTVVLDGEVLGKPADAATAVAMLSRLRGRTHTVWTAVAVTDPLGRVAETVVSTEVVFAPLSDAAIAAYVGTGEPLDKAGAYGIQGRAAAFIPRINGSWSNVVGLPLVETLELLRDAGVALP
jgi:septum formation protein